MKKHNVPKLVGDVLKEIGETPDTACWELPQNKTLVVLHKALERVAAHKNITFDPPTIVESDINSKNVVIVVTGHLGDKSEWSFGEAAPYNNKNAYPFAMAEKRAKDRVILKLVGLHGHVYSEDEADDFKEARPPSINDAPEDGTASASLLTEDQRGFFNTCFNNQDAMSFNAFLSTLTEEQETELFSGFVPGKITSNKTLFRKLESEGLIAWQNLTKDMEKFLDQEDGFGCFEALDELSSLERNHLKKLLGETLTEKVRALANTAADPKPKLQSVKRSQQ